MTGRLYPEGATSVIGSGIVSSKKGYGKLGLLLIDMFLLIDMSEGGQEKEKESQQKESPKRKPAESKQK